MNWRTWAKPLFITSYFILLCVALPLLIIEFRKKSPAFVSAWFIGGMFVLGAVPISLWTILEHLIHYTKPYLQRHIIRILWMVPIYALDAWFALKFPSAAIYFDTLRECYEAYVIYNFMAFLLNYLRHEFPDITYIIEQKPLVKHLPPFCCCKQWTMGRPFIDHCRHGALQYTVIRPITTVIALICDRLGVYGEGDFSFRQAFLYLTIVNNISQVWALYCLVLFYQCTKDELRPMSPVAKFICVKFVVFMSFWQSILIFILAVAGVFKDVKIWEMNDVKSIGILLQNFAICIEMFFAALAHHFSFSYRPYVNPDAPDTGCCVSCWAMWDVSDMQRDLTDHVRHVGSTLRHLRSSHSSTSHRRYPLSESGVRSGLLNCYKDTCGGLEGDSNPLLAVTDLDSASPETSLFQNGHSNSPSASIQVDGFFGSPVTFDSCPNGCTVPHAEPNSIHDLLQP